MNLENLPSPINKTVLYLQRQIGSKKPEIMIVLGSGLSEVMADAKIIKEIPYSDIPGTPVSTVSGHKGVLTIAEYKGKTLAILRGRFHTYEGYSTDDVVRIIRSLALLGAHSAIVTNAAGSTSKKNGPGDIVVLKDHINMSYQTHEGVYACSKGPQYETAAEVRMLNKIGADVVGMSTVPEVIALRQLNVDIVGLSTVSNYGTGVSDSMLSHQEVKVAGQKVSKTLDKLIKIIVDII